MIYSINNKDVTTLMGFNKVILTESIDWSNENLKPVLIEITSNIIDKFTENSNLKDVESARNLLINTFDKVNFLVKNQFDGTIDGTTFNYSNLSGFTSAAFYSEYSNVVDYIKNQNSDFEGALDNSFDFRTDSLTDDQFLEILSILLQGQKDKIVEAYRSFTTDEIADKIDEILVDFIQTPKPKKLNLGNFPKRKNSKDIVYTISSTDYLTDDTIKTNLLNIFDNGKVKLGTTLNYYKPWVGTILTGTNIF